MLEKPHWFLGLLILTAVETSLLTGAFWEGRTELFTLTSSTHALCSIIAFLAAAALAKRGLSPAIHLRVYRLAAFILAAGITALAAISLLPSSSFIHIVTLIASAVVALSYAPLVLAWVELFSHLPISRTFAAFTLSYSGGCLVSLAAVMLSPKWMVELVMAAAILSTMTSYTQCHKELAEQAECESPEPAQAPFPLRPVVICGVVAFITTFLQALNPTGDVPQSIFAGSLLTMAVLGAFATKRDPDLMGLQQVVLVMAVAAILTIPFAGTAIGAVGVALSMTANLAFLVFAETTLCGIALRYRFNAPWLVGISLAVMSVGSLGAVGSAEAFGDTMANQSHATFVAAIMAVLALALFLRFLTEADILGAWGMREHGESKERESDDKISLQMRVFALSCRYGFTKREEEVCALLAQGVNVAGIEEALVVSNSTAKSHVAHIYKKMGIHSIQEFHEAFTR